MSEETIFCRKCNSENKSDVKYCIHCGNPLEERTEIAEKKEPDIPSDNLKGKVLFSIIFLALCLTFIITGIKRTITPVIPDMILKTNHGRKVSLLDLKGREIGLIVYYSHTPCGGHKQCTAANTAVFERLSVSKRYCPYIVYGDETEQAAMDFTRDVNTPILLDTEKKLAKKLDIRYYAVIYYRKDGTIVKQSDGISLMDGPGLEKFLDSHIR